MASIWFDDVLVEKKRIFVTKKLFSSCACFHSRFVVTGSSGQMLRLFDVNSGEELWKAPHFSDQVLDLIKFTETSTGGEFFACGDDYFCRGYRISNIYDTVKVEKIFDKGMKSYALKLLKLSEKFLLCVCSNTQHTIINVAERKVERYLGTTFSGWYSVFGVAKSLLYPNEFYIGQQLREIVERIDFKEDLLVWEYGVEVKCCPSFISCFMSNGREVLVVGYGNKSSPLCLFDAESGRMLMRKDTSPTIEFNKQKGSISSMFMYMNRFVFLGTSRGHLLLLILYHDGKDYWCKLKEYEKFHKRRKRHERISRLKLFHCQNNELQIASTSFDKTCVITKFTSTLFKTEEKEIDEIERIEYLKELYGDMFEIKTCTFMLRLNRVILLL